MIQLRYLFSQIVVLFINLFSQPDLRNIIDIAILTVIVYNVLRLAVRTRASSLMRGILLVFALAWLSNAFEIVAVRWLIQQVVGMGLLVLVIVFQPEMRRALDRLGRSGMSLFDFGPRRHNPETARIVRELVTAALDMSKKRIGALIVFEQRTGLSDVIETGTAVDAKISAPLIENIFEPNTPLHDGAVIITGGRIAAAACILQLTDNHDLSRELGTRHRAAIGITEGTDAVSLIVSEETGVISLARSGRIERYVTEKKLLNVLPEIFDPHVSEEETGTLSRLRSSFTKMMKRAPRKKNGGDADE